MRFIGEFSALGTAVCWATGSNLFAAAGRAMGSVRLNRLRISVACVFLATALLVTRGAPWPVWATPAQIGFLAASGLIGFAFGDTWYFRSLVILGPGRASLISSTSPLFTTALAWPILAERPGPLGAVGIALTLGGVLWVLREQEHRQHHAIEGSAAMGVFAGLLGAIGQSGGYVLSKLALRSGLDPLSATVIRVGAAAVALWFLAAVTRQVGHTLEALRDRRASWFMVGGSFFGPFLGVTLSLAAIVHIPTGIAASITAVYPLLTLFIASRFHGEPITWRILAGTIVAVAGVVVLFLR
jgi:drug/metabolite transporter (DMT)-like permease